MIAFPYLAEDEDDELRDVFGFLIRAEGATRDELERRVKVRVDGEVVTVRQATPWKDDQGVERTDPGGFSIPRRTTLYDAIARRYTTARGDDSVPSTDNPVPVLCHQEHLSPAAVCRVCSVMLARKGEASPRLVPACKYPAWSGPGDQKDDDILEVHTRRSTELVTIQEGAPEVAGEYVGRVVRQVVELIALDHLHDGPGDDRPYHNELLAVSGDLGPPPRPGPGGLVGRDLVSSLSRPRAGRVDGSSDVVRFDPSSCILCDRCVRSCHEVKPFRVISHTGRGRRTRISFDLDLPMRESSCVSCGECAIACPTGALSFRGTVYQDRDPWADQALRPATVGARELRGHRLFGGVPYAFLRWNEGAAGRLELADGAELCRRGEFGSTAFLIEEGTLEVDRGPGVEPLERTPKDVIVGEMACMSNRPRTATIRARGPARVMVIRRNLVHMLRRNKIARDILERAYSERLLDNWKIGAGVFAGLSDEMRRGLMEFLKSRPKGEVGYVRVDPGRTFLRQGDLADCIYFLLEGHVEVSESTPGGGKQARDYLGPGQSLGEIGVLSQVSEAVGSRLGDRRGRRTGHCTALDHVELIRVSRDAFLAMLASDRFPTLRGELERRCLEMIGKNQSKPDVETMKLRNDFLRLGLHQGQNLLVIDLEKCTRCLECVKACADTHGGDSRIYFEWERFDKYLVPAACRSCHDPACLVGCPVDAIHRRPIAGGEADRPLLAVVIEDHCIGCTLCAQNCPFDSIQVHDVRRKAGEVPAPGSPARVAKNCDLCEGGKLGGVPRCVYACPHDAASRESGHALMGLLGLGMLGPSAP